MKRKLPSTPYAICLAGVDIPIVVVRRRSSRRIVIRYQPLRRHVSLTLPRSVSIRQGLNFVQAKEAWVAQQIARHSHSIPFADGQIIPLLGKPCTLRHVGGRGTVTLQESGLLVHGQPEFMHRRVEDWLKRYAKTIIASLASQKAEAIGRRIKKITVRDTHSHWGSCSASGTLSFSWRLALAPYEVLDYVVCHEVAHLKFHNHSADFWTLVETLCPDWQRHYDWIKQNGASLYQYGNLL